MKHVFGAWEAALGGGIVLYVEACYLWQGLSVVLSSLVTILPPRAKAMLHGVV